MSSSILQIGFIPLVDCALLAIAKEKHFFAAQGLCVELKKAQSWGALQENLANGTFDAAHLLLTMPIQSELTKRTSSNGKSSQFATSQNSFCYAFNLSRNGNGIILANLFWNLGIRDSSGLSNWLKKNPQQKPGFGVVFPQKIFWYTV